MERRHNRITGDEADRRILALALDHHLVSRLTSLVAVDATPSRPQGARLTRADLPLNLPAGWEFDKVFGGEHKPLVPLERRADAGRRAEFQQAPWPKPVKTVAFASAVASAPAGVALPRTATDAELEMMAGLLLLGFSLLLLFRRPLHPTAQ